jgi:hypothetical protein
MTAEEIKAICKKYIYEKYNVQEDTFYAECSDIDEYISGVCFDEAGKVTGMSIAKAVEYMNWREKHPLHTAFRVADDEHLMFRYDETPLIETDVIEHIENMMMWEYVKTRKSEIEDRRDERVISGKITEFVIWVVT